MRSPGLLVLLVVAMLLCVSAAPAAAAASDANAAADDWVGVDKGLHFGVSAGLAAGGYGVGAAVFDARGAALAFGGGLAVTAGIAKEALDLSGLGDPSWKDLTWDAIGAASGLALAWSIDLLARGVTKEHPLFLAPHMSRDGGRLTLVVAF